MDYLTKGGRQLGSVALIAILIMAVLPQWSQALELEQVANILPRAQVLLRLTTAQPVDQELLRSLGKLPMRPVNQNRRADIGWVTDGPMFSIPVFRSPDADNHAYFEWSSQAPVRCASWGGKTVPFGRLRPGMVIVQ